MSRDRSQHPLLQSGKKILNLRILFPREKLIQPGIKIHERISVRFRFFLGFFLGEEGVVVKSDVRTCYIDVCFRPLITLISENSEEGGYQISGGTEFVNPGYCAHIRIAKSFSRVIISTTCKTVIGESTCAVDGPILCID